VSWRCEADELLKVFPFSLDPKSASYQSSLGMMQDVGSGRCSDLGECSLAFSVS